MSDGINAGCIVTTDFVTAGSKLFGGYIDYIDRETAVRNENISQYSLYTDYMDNPEKTTELFTAYSDKLSYQEKQELKALYEKAQDNGSPMWQTVISFDNKWLEKNKVFNSEEGFLDVKALHEYTRNAIGSMLKKEGLETATWSAAIHYNTDNFHIHVATVEPIPTRKQITLKTVRFSAKWVKENNIIQNEKIKFHETVSAHRNNNYGYRSICNRLKSALENEGYNTRNLGDYITINSNGTINLSYNGKNDNLPYHSTLIDEHTEYKGKFKQSSIDNCRSSMVNQIIDNQQAKNQINDIIRKQLATAIKDDFVLENRDIIKQFFKVYDNLPPKKSDWQYNNNKYIAKLRPEIDKITKMYLEQHKAEEFWQLKDIIDANDALYREAYGTNSESDYSKNRYKDLFTRCGNAILSTMKNMSFNDLEEYRSKSYISAEVNEAAETGEKIDFDGIINKRSSSKGTYNNNSKYWTDKFKEARELVNAGIESKSDNHIEFASSLFSDALTILNTEIDNGNDLAAFELGKYYAQGTFGEIDTTLAQEYYQKAFQGFNSELNSDEWRQHFLEREDLIKSKKFISREDYEKQLKQLNRQIDSDHWLGNYLFYKVGRMYLDGTGVEKNIEKGIEYLKQSDSSFADYTIGSLYYRGEGVEQNHQLAYDYFDKACNAEEQKPIPFALFNMAEMIENNLVSNSDYNADDLYKLAFHEFVSADEKNPSDMLEYRIAKMLIDGKGVEPNQEEAEKYLRLSSLKGNTFAQTRLASIYLDSGDDEKAELAMGLLEMAANNDNDSAMYQYAKLLLEENSSYFDEEKGMNYLKMAVDKENQFAQYRLGKIFINENTKYYNLNEGLSLFEKSAAQNNQFAQYTLGIIYLNGATENIEQDISKAIEYLTLSAEQGNAFAQYQLGQLYLKNEEMKDIDKALDYLKQAEEQDNSYLKYNLGRIYLDNEEIMDIDKAISYLSDAAEDNNPFAAYTLANLYSKNDFIVSDKEVAEQWYKMAFEGFSALESDQNTKVSDSVLYNLGIMHFNGLGTEQNIEKAIDYLVKAAQDGHEYAQYKLGKIYIDGEGVKQNAEYASLWLKASAEQGNQFAQYQLGKIYYEEEYGLKDIYKSITYLEQSAEQGNQFAQYQLGIIYLKGDDVDRNIKLAYNYLLQATDQNNQFAQYQLGMIFVKGELTNTDYGKAISYFEQSAEQGNQFAQYQLGKLYYFGADGVEVNKKLATNYLNKAAAQGNVYAKALLEWKPRNNTFINFRHEPGFSETMVTLSSDMKMLFDRLANEHEHMLNQMIFNHLEKEKSKAKGETIEQ
ncbi:MAG: relaxase MobL [Lachnospiraceae bacterium]|nr:relaxase MobL [Lachnospiraceae bacterium]